MCIYICVYIHIYIYIYVHVYIYIYIHKQIHALTFEIFCITSDYANQPYPMYRHASMQ